MNQGPVIAALEIDLGLLVNAVVDQRVQAVAFADGGDGAAHAVLEQFFDLEFRRQPDIIAELPSELREPNAVRRRQYR